MVPSGSMLPVMSILTVRGASPVNLSKVALAIGGVPVAPPMRTTAVWRLERLSSLSIAWTVILKAPAAFICRLVEFVVKQQLPLPEAAVVSHRSQATGPPSGSTAGKLTETTVPTGPDVGETERVPDGGCPGFEAGKMVA